MLTSTGHSTGVWDTALVPGFQMDFMPLITHLRTQWFTQFYIPWLSTCLVQASLACLGACYQKQCQKFCYDPVLSPCPWSWSFCFWEAISLTRHDFPFANPHWLLQTTFLSFIRSEMASMKIWSTSFLETQLSPRLTHTFPALHSYSQRPPCNPHRPNPAM